jgi:murein DD-endopeptidase MepM/ murein hydrolase activator NlpD
MRTLEPSRSRAFRHVAIIALIAAGAAGCSSDSTRFSENPFASPTESRQAMASRQAPAEVTGSIPRTAAAPASRIEAQPLAAPQQQAAIIPPPPPPVRGSSAGGAGMASYHPQSDVTGSIKSRPAGTLPGQIPAARAPASQPVASNGVHVVQPGETLYSLARKYRKSPAAIIKANKLAADYRVKIGDRVVIPGAPQAGMQTASAASKPVAAPPAVTPAVQTKPVAAAPTPKVQSASLDPKPAPQTAPAQATARVAAPTAESIEAASGVTSNETTGGAPSFRWPVRGRVIQGFGPKGNGQQNDGINLAVPEGTSVKAAEDGVVAYAGNELKGYGNLVLVRHSNGFVTAYAHASEVSVKRGDPVKRGQIIAKAGQTGNVNSPQLHFEIRKGATPVDPSQYLGAN